MMRDYLRVQGIRVFGIISKREENIHAKQPPAIKPCRKYTLVTKYTTSSSIPILSISPFPSSISAMDAKLNKFFESVGNFFSGGDQIPWCDRDIISGCEREVAEANKGSSEETKGESIMRLSWALVHSRQPEDVQRGIAMLEASLSNVNSPLQMRERLYLLAVGYYRSGDYTRSRQLVDRCLEIAPDWRQALTLKKTIEEKITKDGVIGIGIAATAVGVVVGGLAAVLARKKC